MQIGDAVRFRVDASHRDMLGPMADEFGIVTDVFETDGVETLTVKFGDIGPLEAGVPATEFEMVRTLRPPPPKVPAFQAVAADRAELLRI